MGMESKSRDILVFSTSASKLDVMLNNGHTHVCASRLDYPQRQLGSPHGPIIKKVAAELNAAIAGVKALKGQPRNVVYGQQVTNEAVRLQNVPRLVSDILTVRAFLFATLVSSSFSLLLLPSLKSLG